MLCNIRTYFWKPLFSQQMYMCYVFKQPKYAAWIQNVLNQILTHSRPVTGQKHPEVTAS